MVRLGEGQQEEGNQTEMRASQVQNLLCRNELEEFEEFCEQEEQLEISFTVIGRDDIRNILGKDTAFALDRGLCIQISTDLPILECKAWPWNIKNGFITV